MVELVVGDAIGTILEFKARGSHFALNDMAGGSPFGLKAGQWTDDTAMTLALAESHAGEADLNERDLLSRFGDGQKTIPIPPQGDTSTLKQRRLRRSRACAPAVRTRAAP